MTSIGQNIIDLFRGKTFKKIKESDFYTPNPYMTPKHKINFIKNCQKKYGAKIFVETGTYLGDTTLGVSSCFEKLYTIELCKELYEKATKRFKNIKKIITIQGDSAEMLEEIVPSLDQRAIFWLDGHYDGGDTASCGSGCPLMQELEIIFANNKDHIILIDDARLFGTLNYYPSLKEVLDYIHTKDTDYIATIQSDIITVLKK